MDKAKARYGHRANLPTSGMEAGELLWTVDRGTMWAALSDGSRVPVVPEVDALAALVGSGVVSTQDYVLIHDADEPGAKEKKILVGELLVAMGAVPSSMLGQPGGVATLGPDGKVPTAQLPDAVLGALRYQGTWNASTNVPSIPAVASSNRGHYYVVSTAGATTVDGESDWQVGDWLVSSGTSWGKVDNSDKVSSVAGRTGVVVLVKGDVGLGSVDNTSDVDKPVSTAQQAALDGKVSKAGDTMTGDLSIQRSTDISITLKKLDGTVLGKIRVNQTGSLVISATNGVYLRPNGDSSSTNQAVFPPSGAPTLPGSYTAGAPAATGYVAVNIGGVNYKLLAST